LTRLLIAEVATARFVTDARLTVILATLSQLLHRIVLLRLCSGFVTSAVPAHSFPLATTDLAVCTTTGAWDFFRSLAIFLAASFTAIVLAAIVPNAPAFPAPPGRLRGPDN